MTGAARGLADDEASATDATEHFKFVARPVDLAQPQPLSVADSKRSVAWRAEAASWEELHVRLTVPSEFEDASGTAVKDGSGYVLGELDGPSRTKRTLVSRWALTLDYDALADHGVTLQQLVTALDDTGWAAYVHTTFSHAPEAPRARVIIPLSRHVSRAEFAHLSACAAERIGVAGLDGSSHQAERFMFWPLVSKGQREHYQLLTVRGRSARRQLDVERVLEAMPMAEVSSRPAAFEAVELAPLNALEADKATAVLAKHCRKLSSTPEGGGEHGGRNNALNAHAHQLFSWEYHYGWSDPATIESALTHVALTAGLDADEVAGTLASARRAAEHGAPVSRPEVDLLEPVAATDGPGGDAPRSTGHRLLAEQVAQRLGARVIHTPGLGWLAWDGARFERDEALAKQMLTGVVVEVKVHAARRGDAVLARAGLQWDSSAGVNGVMNLLGSMPGIHTPPDLLDADPYLINVANGVLDLRTMELEPHSPAERLTKKALAAYKPGAHQDSAWETFIAEVLPDPEVRGYLQRYVGQALLGTVREHLLALLTGEGRNGKGVFYIALAHALGDYAATAVPELLLDTGTRGGASPELMVLRGARWVTLSETGAGRALDEATVKRLTGGDTISARYLYGALVEFDPSHTLAMVTNHLPRVRQSDAALWARMRVIDFPVSFLGREDQGLGDRLKLEADAVLAWALEGWQAYDALGGLGEPPGAVMRATREYEQASDVVVRFLGDECEAASGARVRFAELYEAWERWAAKHGGAQARAMTKVAFGRKLDALGHSRITGAKGAAYRDGLALANAYAADDFL